MRVATSTKRFRAAFWGLFQSLAAILCALLMLGCDYVGNKIVSDAAATDKRNNMAKQVVYNALAASTNAESQAWQQFLAHWPFARQSGGLVWDEALKKFRPDVMASALIEDRYVFRIILDFEVSEDYQEVVFQKFRLNFFEVKEVQLPPEGAGHGGTMTTFQPYSKWFGLKEWKELVDSNWDFSKLGITIVSNAPIPNIRSVPNL
ncbi:MAG: hypothetical protein DME19_03505 [Verrucomicrobia bacterium]|nr:MAG: hypothetical protein DME19_03505 [Verrucomicrobiota bacterium]